MYLATVPGLIFAVAVMIGAGHIVSNPSASYGLLVTVVGGGGAVVLYALVLQATAGSRVRVPDQASHGQVRRTEQAALAWVSTYEHIHVGTRNQAGGAVPPR